MSLNLKKTCFLASMYRLAQISSRQEFYVAYNTSDVELGSFEKESIVPISWIEKLFTLAKTPQEFDTMMSLFNALYSKALNMPTLPQKNKYETKHLKPKSQMQLGKSNLDIQLTPELIATIKKNREKDLEFPSKERIQTIVDTALACCQKNNSYDELAFKDFILQLVPAAVKVHVYDFHVIVYDKNGMEKSKVPLPLDKKFI